MGHQEGSQLNIQLLGVIGQTSTKVRAHQNMQTMTKTNYKLNFDRMTLQLSVQQIGNLQYAASLWSSVWASQHENTEEKKHMTWIFPFTFNPNLNFNDRLRIHEMYVEKV